MLARKKQAEWGTGGGKGTPYMKDRETHRVLLLLLFLLFTLTNCMQQHWTHPFRFCCKNQVFIIVDVMKEWFMACWCLLSVIAYLTQDFPTWTFLSGPFYKQWSSSSSSEEDRETNIQTPRVNLRGKKGDWPRPLWLQHRVVYFISTHQND